MVGQTRRRRSSLALVRQEADVRFYLHRLEESGPDGLATEPPAVLVLGAANGRIAWELGRVASRVVGVEPSERMVAVAEALRREQPGDIGARVRFLHADPRSLRLGERFPLVVAPQNALGLLRSRGDLELLVATVEAHLEKGGLFAFDVLNPPQGPDAEDDGPHRPEPPPRMFAPHFALAPNRGGAGVRTSALHRWRRRLFTAQELDDGLRAGGLTPRERYGSFDGKVFEPGDLMQVVIASSEA